jgi:hypothetical protein
VIISIGRERTINVSERGTLHHGSGSTLNEEGERGEAAAATPPIVCALTPEAIRAGRAGLLPGLAVLATSREPTVSGYRLVFQASEETLTAITQTINAERQCCRWLRFELVVHVGAVAARPSAAARRACKPRVSSGHGILE